MHDEQQHEQHPVLDELEREEAPYAEAPDGSLVLATRPVLFDRRQIVLRLRRVLQRRIARILWQHGLRHGQAKANAQRMLKRMPSMRNDWAVHGAR